jgi:hypothetical protein
MVGMSIPASVVFHLRTIRFIGWETLQRRDSIIHDTAGKSSACRIGKT